MGGSYIIRGYNKYPAVKVIRCKVYVSSRLQDGKARKVKTHAIIMNDRTAWSTAIPAKALMAYLVRKFSDLQRIRHFINIFTGIQHLKLPLARRILSTPFNLFYFKVKFYIFPRSTLRSPKHSLSNSLHH
jgi:hypothetical protein